MYLSAVERKEVMVAYGCEESTEINHHKVGPDTWVYLFECDNKKYILIITDYTGDYEFDIFPHLLKFENDRLEFVLQREMPLKDKLSKEKTSGAILFEYTEPSVSG